MLKYFLKCRLSKRLKTYSVALVDALDFIAPSHCVQGAAHHFNLADALRNRNVEIACCGKPVVSMNLRTGRLRAVIFNALLALSILRIRLSRVPVGSSCIHRPIRVPLGVVMRGVSSAGRLIDRADVGGLNLVGRWSRKGVLRGASVLRLNHLPHANHRLVLPLHYRHELVQ